MSVKLLAVGFDHICTGWPAGQHDGRLLHMGRKGSLFKCHSRAGMKVPEGKWRCLGKRMECKLHSPQY
ncbi:hypothetical protein ILYODFUR_019386 [Ilyodon furcidens]|uniref:Uncharacterized protein n=1 Tax=Ilyodon furcidens TaxID=33524 RepID=A0ABV0TVZ2_9TELE